MSESKTTTPPANWRELMLIHCDACHRWQALHPHTDLEYVGCPECGAQDDWGDRCGAYDPESRQQYEMNARVVLHRKCKSVQDELLGLVDVPDIGALPWEVFSEGLREAYQKLHESAVDLFSEQRAALAHYTRRKRIENEYCFQHGPEPFDHGPEPERPEGEEADGLNVAGPQPDHDYRFAV